MTFISANWTLTSISFTAGFNDLETFVLAYYLGFLDTVDAFTSSFVERQFAVPCQTLKTLAHAECIGVDAESVTFGTLGLLLAAGCTVALYIRASTARGDDNIIIYTF